MNEIEKGKPALYEQQSSEQKQLEILKSTVAKGATREELQLFAYVAKKRGLDPFTRQIHFYKQYDKQGKHIPVIVTGIDGYRLIADRTDKYVGQVGPFWCGKDGLWSDVWLKDEPPSAAKVGILRKGFQEPIWGVALYSAYAKVNEAGNPNYFWRRDPAGQLAKCAEALAFRKGFPQELSGLYTRDEIRDIDQEDIRAAASMVAEEEPKTVDPLSLIIEEMELCELPDEYLPEELRGRKVTLKRFFTDRSLRFGDAEKFWIRQYHHFGEAWQTERGKEIIKRMKKRYPGDKEKQDADTH